MLRPPPPHPLSDPPCATGMWPPQQPDVPRGLLAKRSYFRHQSHPQATEVHASVWVQRLMSDMIAAMLAQGAWVLGQPCSSTHAPPLLALQLRGIEATGTGGSSDGGSSSMRYFQEDPKLPYRGAKIMSSQPELLLDFTTGLNTTMFA